jgi:NAD+ synthase (glutamine-hydrolysing)
VGGNDELVFDGDSQVYGPDGKLRVCGKAFEEDLVVFDVDKLPPAQAAPELDDVTAIHKTLVLGIRDYCRKCGFKKAVLGLSGGIDSSLVAALAAEALGPENVVGVSMPSIYSSRATIEDPEILARNLGIQYEVIPINPAHETFLNMLGKNLGDDNASDLARQNLQARIRGTLLMALSNRHHWMLLATGNKSELATGYCTLYGDMCGGLAPIGDVLKTQVYKLSRRVNRERELIPVRVLTRAPSAELKPNQTDQDSLPPYEILDDILEAYVEGEKGVDEIVKMGFSRDVVNDVQRRIATSEHKRRQAPPTIKVTSRAFGHGRRLPIARKIP